jgi:hypothetical protein
MMMLSTLIMKRCRIVNSLMCRQLRIVGQLEAIALRCVSVLVSVILLAQSGISFGCVMQKALRGFLSALFFISCGRSQTPRAFVWSGVF